MFSSGNHRNKPSPTTTSSPATAKAAAPAACTARAPHEHSAFMLQRMSHFFNVVAEVLLWSVPWLELRFFMPHFSKETTATLKAALRARAGEGYRFSDHDIEKLATSTSLSAAQVKQWNHNILHYYQTDQAKEAYVAGNDKVSTKRCDITTLCFLETDFICRWKMYEFGISFSQHGKPIVKS